MVVNGQGGSTLGFAPGADLHQGHLNYNAGVNWRTLGNHMRDAASIGAIASNNSWGIPRRGGGRVNRGRRNAGYLDPAIRDDDRLWHRN